MSLPALDHVLATSTRADLVLGRLNIPRATLLMLLRCLVRCSPAAEPRPSTQNCPDSQLWQVRFAADTAKTSKKAGKMGHDNSTRGSYERHSCFLCSRLESWWFSSCCLRTSRFRRRWRSKWWLESKRTSVATSRLDVENATSNDACCRIKNVPHCLCNGRFVTQSEVANVGCINTKEFVAYLRTKGQVRLLILWFLGQRKNCLRAASVAPRSVCQSSSQSSNDASTQSSKILLV